MTWPLRPGDTVALVAPAGPVTVEKLAAGAAVLESWGLRVRRATGLLARHPQLPYLAGTDAERARDFTEAWLDPEVTAVFAARGGYGCPRVLDLLDWEALRQAPPTLFAGSSDTTALHDAVGARLGLPTLFCPMPATSYFDAAAAAHLRATLFEPGTVRVLTGPEAGPLVPGRAEGRLVGGNLSLLAAGAGTPGTRPARDGIAVLEDVGEEPYRIDRMLTQLLRAGWFAGVRGIVLGSWTGCGDPRAVREVLRDRLGPLGVPVLCGLRFGHCPSALTVPLGVPAELDAAAARVVVRQRRGPGDVSSSCRS
ncbi:muramoyltetrapeptide carboxypeptidase [Prauserella shujinwangii]|uniref:Muramoyltetrapeptide carboxypeptidase n=1 Tax=Prauserella shujinwangii TaxID=1453103 RepID=A0A2T0LP80_9PSEU|nr:LD-carboxypeptidase [Prauserella shujinwangii]PRX44976.1 muramoyltetrapeptide carboxypeptidase [Prauserella shujinwangii]